MGDDQTRVPQLNMNRFLLLGLSLLAAVNLPNAGLAANTAPFFLTTQTVEIPESGIVTNTVLCTPSCEFAFLPPRDWKLGFHTNAIRLTWQKRDLASEITLTVVFKEGGQIPQLQPEILRGIALSRHPGAVIVEEFPCYTRNAKGLAFDMENVSARQFKSNSRLAFIPFKGGWVELALTSPSDQFAEDQLELGLLLNSLGIESRAAK